MARIMPLEERFMVIDADASSEVDAIAIFRGNNSIGAAAKKKILDDNPRALYAL